MVSRVAVRRPSLSRQRHLQFQVGIDPARAAPIITVLRHRGLSFRPGRSGGRRAAGRPAPGRAPAALARYFFL